MPSERMATGNPILDGYNRPHAGLFILNSPHLRLQNSIGGILAREAIFMLLRSIYKYGVFQQPASTTVSINSWYYAWQFAQEVNFHAQAE